MRLPAGTTATHLAAGVFAVVLAIFTWLILQTGTSGGFLFDDLWNLALLNNFPEGVRTWADLRHYLSVNTAGPTGRPVAMLSFLLQQDHWPESARAMLQFNLLIHCLIGLVIFFLVRRLAARVDGIPQNAVMLIALLATAIWLLHPLQVSTVFYVIQRMAQLSTLFILLGIYVYVAARERLDAGRLYSGILLLIATVLLGVIGLYAKENAILLPIALLLTEYWFFRDRSTFPRLLMAVRISFLWLPATVIVGYLLLEIGATGYEARPFGPGERLATQAQVMLHYLQLLAVPQSITPGIFYDSYPVARSWLQPGVIAGLLTVLIATVLSFHFRQQAPLATWGILFFLAMHLIESTTRPLELVFEHRNYLPSAGLALAMASGLYTLTRHYRVAGLTAIVLWLGLSTAQAHLRATNWGDPDLQAELWVRENPDSPRAWLQFTRRANAMGDYAGVQYGYMQWERLHPDSANMHISRLVRACPDEALPDSESERLFRAVAHGPGEPGLMQAVNRLTMQTIREECAGLSIEQVYTLIRTLIENPNVTRSRHRKQLWDLAGRIMLAADFIDDAMMAFTRANETRRNDMMLIRQVAELSNNGYRDEARRLLETFRDNPATPVHHRLHVYWLLFPYRQHFVDLEQAIDKAEALHESLPPVDGRDVPE